MKKNLPVTEVERVLSAEDVILSATNPHGIITYANPDFVRISGFTQEELIHKNHNIVRHPDMPPAAFADLWATLKGGQPWMGIVKNRCKNGDYYWVDAYVTLRKRDGQVVEYQSSRVKPTRERVERAQAIYARINEGKPSGAERRALSVAAKLALGFAVALCPLFTAALLAAGPALVGVAALASLGLASAGVRVLLRPWQALVAEVRGVVDNRLLQFVYTGRTDEVGQVQHAFTMLKSELRTVVVCLAGVSNKLAAAAEELSVHTMQLSKGGQEQAQQATQAAAAVEGMSATVTEMAKNAQGVASTAQDANRAAGQGHEVVASSVAGITRLAETVRSSAERIQSLGHRSEQIGEIVRVIEDIADQTNLLALNAAIEAARAGEQGRGFAVVADEVRKLAERTTKATKEIADTIRTIQGDTGGAVASMETGTREAQEGMAMVNKAGERLDEIVGAVQTVTGMIQQMAAAIEEQSTATEQIAGNIETVAAVSKRNEGGLAQVTQETGELARLAAELQSMVEGFRRKG
jgi:aerotaxis receptor